MHLDVYNTHMELYPYTKDDYPVIEKMYTAVDKHSGMEVPCGYIIEDGKLFLPRGTSLSQIESICHVKANYIQESDPSEKMSRQFYSLYDPRDKLQEDSIKFLTTEGNHQLALNLKTGLGKAQPMSTRIPTTRGYKLMKEIKVGDKIFGSDSKSTTVTDIFPQGIKKVYEITFSDGRKARCCDEHLWTVYDGEKPKTKQLKDIMLDYKAYVYKNDNGDRDPHNYRYQIPVITSPVVYQAIRTKYEPYSSGQLFGSRLYGARTDSLPDTIRNREITLSKGIPGAVKYDSIERRVMFLKGLLDTAGIIAYDIHYGDHSTFRIYSGHVQFLEDLKELALGLCCRVTSTPNGGMITIATPHFIDKMMRPERYTGTDKPDDFLNRLTIKDIRYVGEEECQCIMVDSPDHLYLTEDFIVTHNTFCVAYSSTKLNEKTLIITPNESLKQQWINTYTKMFDYRPKNLINIAGSNIMDSIMEDLVPEADVYFVNHATLRNYLTQNNGFILHKFFKKLNVGIKVYDEAHMEFGNIMLIDFFSNTNRTWYLTATFDRSDKTESVCFKRATNAVSAFGEVQSNEVVEKHVVYHVVNINSHISPKERATVIGYAGMSAASYGKYAFQRDINQTAYNAILMILNKMKNVEGKTLIFVPLIEAVDDVVNKLKRDFPDKSVAAYHSKISKEEKEAAEKKDVIVSTIKSCGTGKDIVGLRCVICAEPIASKVVTEQMIGRLRPYAKDMETFFFDIVDICIPPINWWFRSRIKKAEALCKKVVYLNIDK